MLSKHEEMCDRALRHLFETSDFPSSRRASGECLCPECKAPYREHPQVVPFYWLNILCTGEYVKL